MALTSPANGAIWDRHRLEQGHHTCPATPAQKIYRNGNFRRSPSHTTLGNPWDKKKRERKQSGAIAGQEGNGQLERPAQDRVKLRSIMTMAGGKKKKKKKKKQGRPHAACECCAPGSASTHIEGTLVRVAGGDVRPRMGSAARKPRKFLWWNPASNDRNECRSLKRREED